MRFRATSQNPPSTGPARFSTTHWSIVAEAAQDDSPNASDAMAQLCRSYWYPLYAYVRRKGYDAPDAQDLTQEFFARLLARNFLNVADRNKGKFRSFLLGSMEHFLAREWTKARAQKRGGSQTIFSLDALNAETRYRMEPVNELTADRIFERRWATTVLEEAMARLADESIASQKGDLFAKLQPFLSGDNGDDSYGETAASLNMTAGAIKVAIHRLRQRFGELVREEIARTVAAPAQVDDELRYLVALLRE
jgi:DNA-directed RNA polymerase specialized sigma24 family protein